MVRQKILFALAFLWLIAGIPLWAGTEKDAKTEAWVKSMTPGAPQAALAEQVGKWRYVATFWDDPKSEPMTFEGTATKTMIMGGRYLKEECTGDVHDQQFEGYGVTGFDNVTREYVSVWFDNMSTGIDVSTGREDAKGKRTFQATMHDPMTGKAIPTRSSVRTIDHDHHTYESYVKGPDGGEQLRMRVQYTRAD